MPVFLCCLLQVGGVSLGRGPGVWANQVGGVSGWRGKPGEDVLCCLHQVGVSGGGQTRRRCLLQNPVEPSVFGNPHRPSAYTSPPSPGVFVCEVWGNTCQYTFPPSHTQICSTFSSPVYLYLTSPPSSSSREHSVFWGPLPVLVFNHPLSPEPSYHLGTSSKS